MLARVGGLLPIGNDLHDKAEGPDGKACDLNDREPTFFRTRHQHHRGQGRELRPQRLQCPRDQEAGRPAFDVVKATILGGATDPRDQEAPKTQRPHHDQHGGQHARQRPRGRCGQRHGHDREKRQCPDGIVEAFRAQERRGNEGQEVHREGHRRGEHRGRNAEEPGAVNASCPGRCGGDGERRAQHAKRSKEIAHEVQMQRPGFGWQSGQGRVCRGSDLLPFFDPVTA